MLFLLVLLWNLPIHAAAPLWAAPWKNVSELITLLESTEKGKLILAAARKQDPKLAEHIRSGKASFTERAAAFTYSAETGKQETRPLQRITLKQGLALSDAVADLAHELTHLAERPLILPYEPGFSLPSFVREGVEGKGGELAAFENECLLSWSLEAREPSFPKHKYCERFRRAGDQFHRESARLDYYSLGPKWHGAADPALKKALPELSAAASVFTAGFNGRPYPISLAQEFEKARLTACEANFRKFQLLKNQGARDQNSASVKEERKVMVRFAKEQKCRAEP